MTKTRTFPRASRSRPVALAFFSLLTVALACNFPGHAGTPSATAGPSTRSATIKEIVGRVVTGQAAGAAESPAALDQVVPAGGQVETQADAKAKLELSQAGTPFGVARLGPDTTLTLLELTANEAGPVSRFGLLAGKVWIVLAETGGGEGIVETPGGIASVRGSQMSVEYYSNYAGTGAPLLVVTCLQGVCSVNNPFGGVTLTPGQQTEAAGSGVGPGQGHPIDPERLADWNANVPEIVGQPIITPTSSEAAPPPTTPAPGVTPPTETLTPTPSDTPSPTPLGPPFITVIQDANIRGGPGTVYPVLGVLKTGATANVLGQDQTKTWFVIVFPQSPDGRGWIWGKLVTLGGDTSNIPIIAAPPTPTFTPTHTPLPTNTFTPSPTVPSPTPSNTPIPDPTIDASPNPVDYTSDYCATISWSAPGAVSATLDGQTVRPKGSEFVCLQKDQTFTLVATYPDSSQKSVSVKVTIISAIQ